MYRFSSLFLIISLCCFGMQAHAERAALIVDANSGRVLHAQNVNLPSYPASLTKLMTIFLIFEAVSNRKLSFSDQFTVSKKAQDQKGSRLGLKAGDEISLEEIVMALVVRSGNDAAMVAAEVLADSEEDFVAKMNLRAKFLGMKNTVFTNASGLPDPLQLTTARDLAVLAVEMFDRFPKYFHLFSVEKFTYKKRVHKSHNHFALGYSGAYGMKTGYTCNAGYNLITLVRRKNKELIGVVLGGESHKARDGLMVDLMDQVLDQNPRSWTSNKSLDDLRYDLSQGAKKVANLDAIARVCGSKISPKRLPKKAIVASIQ